MRRCVLALATALYCSATAIASDTDFEVELRGTISYYTYPNPISGSIQRSTVLKLFAPVELAADNTESKLDNVTVVELLSRDDKQLQEFGQYRTKAVAVRCKLGSSTLWGYRHASCSPSSLHVIH